MIVCCDGGCILVSCCMIDSYHAFFRGLGFGVVVSVTLTEVLFGGLCRIGLGIDFLLCYCCCFLIGLLVLLIVLVCSFSCYGLYYVLA